MHGDGCSESDSHEAAVGTVLCLVRELRLSMRNESLLA